MLASRTLWVNASVVGRNAVPPARRARPMLGKYSHIPIELFRVNDGPQVRLRDSEQQHNLGRRSYDLHLGNDGLVHPIAGDLFECAFSSPRSSLRTGVPQLVLYHEHSDHYSLQCAIPMTLNDLNKNLTKFFNTNGEVMTKEEWCERYPF